LNETTYHFGDRWHVINADTETNRIVAELRFFEEEEKFWDAGHPFSRPEQVRRTLRLEAMLLDIHQGAVLQLDFSSRIEGLNQSACDLLVNNLVESIDAVLGGGTPITKALAYRLPAPPWWLYVLTVACLIGGNFALQAIGILLSPLFLGIVLALISGGEIGEFLEPLAGMYGAATELLLVTGASLIGADFAAPFSEDDHKRPQRPSLPRW